MMMYWDLEGSETSALKSAGCCELRAACPEFSSRTLQDHQQGPHKDKSGAS